MALSLPTNRNDQYKLLAAIVFLAGAGLYYNFVWTPKAEKLATIAAHADSLKSMNERARTDVARGSIDKLRAQSAEFNQEVDIMRQLVPTGNEVPALLASVSDAARRANLDVSTFSPDGKIEGDQFDTYKFKLAATGPYNKIAEFLTNVGELRRIVAPINLALAPSNAQDRNKDKAVRLLDATFDIQTYVAHTSPAETPAPKKEGQ
jgi:type IV pilus assembly protein PilO